MPSPREDVAINLADTVSFCGLNEHHRGHFRGEGDHAWVVLFEKSGVIKGSIHVYNPKKIVIQWQSPTRKGTVNATREFEARDFFRKFIES